MSFLLEVLSSAEQSDIDTSKKYLPIMSEKILKYKGEINQYIEDAFVRYQDWPKKNQHLVETTTQLSSDIQELQDKIEQIAMKDVEKKISEVSDLTLELQKASFALKIVSDLVRINEVLVEAKELRGKEEHCKAAAELFKADKLLRDIPEDEVTETVGGLREGLRLEIQLVQYKILEQFDMNVRITQTNVENIQKNFVHIKNDLHDVMSALVLFDYVYEVLSKMGRTLCEDFCRPVLTGVASIKVEEAEGASVLTVAVRKSSARITYKEVLQKLLEIFAFLHDHFDYPVEDTTTICFIGNQIMQELSDKILKECLSETYAAGEGDSDNKKLLVDDIRTFQEKLVKIGIYSEASNPFLDFLDGMDLTLINRKCQAYVEIAIATMKRDLHDTTEVGVKYDPDNPLSTSDFPECFVSRSAVELLDLAEKIIQDALSQPDVIVARMIEAVRSIFHQYGSVVSAHHRKLLQTIPQQVALFRNNCIYMAHQLTEMNEKYDGQFSEHVLPLPPLFTDQGHQLRTVGNEVFSSYLEEQIALMDSTLNEFNFSFPYISDKLHPELDKCIRQCIRQQELLKTVWLKILPHSFYIKTLGHLLNSFCKKLIAPVLACEDIPSKNAETLVELFKIVQTRGPRLFFDPHEIYLCVESWQKFCDLIFVLAASLADIGDKWSEGKGPLTLHFNAEEVRTLIKALFQNTDRRTAVLKKIH